MRAPPGPALTQALVQRPALLPYLSLLPVTSAQLEEVAARAVASNPLITRSAGGPCLGCGRHCGQGAYCRSCSLQRVDDRTASRRDDWRDALEAEARLELPPRLHSLLAEVVGSLDEHGLLVRTGPDPRPLAQVIVALRTVGPPGVAARSGADCVSVQIAALAEAGVLPEWAAALTLDDLSAALKGDAPPEVLSVLPAIVASVTPHVVLPDAAAIAPAPDVRFRIEADGALAVEVLDADWFGLVMDEALWASAGAEGRAWLRPYRKDARRLLEAMGARASLLRRLAVWLGQAQGGFLRDGRAAHRPLTRGDAARALGHHPATIGRAVSGKTARCPDGRLEPLAAFFGGRTATMETLRQLAEAHPHATDDSLAGLLAASGHPVARRTVAKYRALLGLPTNR